MEVSISMLSSLGFIVQAIWSHRGVTRQDSHFRKLIVEGSGCGEGTQIPDLEETEAAGCACSTLSSESETGRER